MATPSKNSRVARQQKEGVKPRVKITHLLFHGGKPGVVQYKPLGRYASEEEAVAAQAKFKHLTILTSAWGNLMRG